MDVLYREALLPAPILVSRVQRATAAATPHTTTPNKIQSLRHGIHPLNHHRTKFIPLPPHPRLLPPHRSSHHRGAEPCLPARSFHAPGKHSIPLSIAYLTSMASLMSPR